MSAAASTPRQPTAVIAIGGNALICQGQLGTFDEQFANALEVGRSIRTLIDEGWKIIVVHGNGPQIGNLAIQGEHSVDLVPALPLFVLGAMTQGSLGSLIAIAIQHTCGDVARGVVAVVTHAQVERDDPAFASPTKPIGPFFPADQVAQLEASHGWVMADDAGRGYRRVVPSPAPRTIVEASAIAALIEAGFIVIAAGGGGIPVAVYEGQLSGVDAVIDKDLAASCIALAAQADALVMVTGVSNVRLDFGQPTERAVDELNVDDARRYLADGQFPPGSMGPKVTAAIAFVDSHQDRVAVITTAELVAATLRDRPSISRGLGCQTDAPATERGTIISSLSALHPPRPNRDDDPRISAAQQGVTR
jgi:carbamate kinase